MQITLSFFILLSLHGFLATAETPVFSNDYEAKGRILLPYAEIDEPFHAYYSLTQNKSRIDYYGDLMQTLQRPDLSKFFTFAYMVNGNGDPIRVCFNLEGDPISPVNVQSVLPNLSNFKKVYTGACNKVSKKIKLNQNDCEVWEYDVTNGQKQNKYVFVLRRDNQQQPIPIYYMMMGYDSLIGSHYDKYELIYETYQTGSIDSKVFEIYKPFTCRAFPGPGRQHLATINPIREFINGEFDHVEESFSNFVENHGKKYHEKKEYALRQSIFQNNYRFIMSHNRKSVSYKLKVNHLADRSSDELRMLRGRISSENNEYNGGMPFDKTKYDLSKVPTQWDWRLLGAVTPVKDQAICGSCWSFGTTGTIEGVYFVKTGKLLKLSEQQLIDCSWSQANDGCDGGEDFRSYKYLQQTGGIALTEDYGPYLGVDGKCHDKKVKKSVKVTGFYNITSNDPESMKIALYNHGPVTVAIDASQKSFTFYSHGIYYDPKCSPTNLDHQVLAVGYGEINGEKYWLIKNSWSTYWGNDGYVLISQKDNDCGVLTDATFPVVE